MGGETLPHPTEVSNPEAAREYLYSGRTPNQALSKLPGEGGEGARTIEANKLYTCEVCTFDIAHPVRVRLVDRGTHEKGRAS